MVDDSEISKEEMSQSADYGSIVGEVPKAKTKYTSTQWWTLISLAFGTFCVGACVALQAPFFPSEAEAKGASPTEYGFIFGAYQLTIFVFAPFVGKLVLYLSPKLLVNVGIATVGITCILFGTLDMLPSGPTFVAAAFVVRIIEGMGAAVMKTCCYTIVGYQFKENIGTTFATMEIFMGVGLITGPTLGGALYDIGGYGLPFYFIGCLIMVDATFIFFMLPKIEKEKMPEKGNMLKFWLHYGTLIYSLSVFSTFNYIGFNAVSLEPHLRQFELSGFKLGMMFAIAGTVYAFSAPVWGWLSDRKCGQRILSMVGSQFMIASLLLIGPAPFFSISTTLPYVLVALTLLGLGTGSKIINSFSGTLKETLERGFPQDLNTYALVSSMIATSQSLGAFVGPSLGGFLLEELQYRKATLTLLALEVFLVFLFITAICKEKIQKKGFKNAHDQRIPLQRNSTSKDI